MMGPVLQMGKLGCRGARSQSEHGLSCVELQPRQYLHLCPDLDIMGGDSVKFCKMSELLSRSCILFDLGAYNNSDQQLGEYCQAEAPWGQL